MLILTPAPMTHVVEVVELHVTTGPQDPLDQVHLPNAHHAEPTDQAEDFNHVEHIGCTLNPKPYTIRCRHSRDAFGCLPTK